MWEQFIWLKMQCQDQKWIMWTSDIICLGLYWKWCSKNYFVTSEDIDSNIYTKNWVRNYSTRTTRIVPRHWIMMRRVLKMQDKQAFFCVIFITALDTHKRVYYLLLKKKYFSTEPYQIEKRILITKYGERVGGQFERTNNRVNNIGQLEKSKTDVL